MCDFFFTQIHYFFVNKQNLPLIVERLIFLAYAIFCNVRFFCINILLFHQNCQISRVTIKLWIFLKGDIFKHTIFCTNTLLFHWKSTKFLTNFQSMNFSNSWYIYKCSNLLHYDILQKIGKILDFSQLRKY